jgi:predicted RNA-binding protein with EMAP domain
MLISKPEVKVEDVKLSELQKMALSYLPLEQVTKFEKFPDLIEKELMNEAREPEMSNVLKDLFNALHEANTPKLLRVLQGDQKLIFYAFRKQLMEKKDLTKREAKILSIIIDDEISLLSVSMIKE